MLDCVSAHATRPARRMIELDVAIGAHLREARLRAGLTQEQLGERLGITFQQVQKYENGKNRISASTLIRAAQALSTTAAAILAPFEADTPIRPALTDTSTLRVVELMGGLPLPSARRQVLAFAELVAQVCDPSAS